MSTGMDNFEGDCLEQKKKKTRHSREQHLKDIEKAQEAEKKQL